MRMFDGNRTEERCELPIAALRELPALEVLEALPVPVLAFGQDGSILFANGLFAEMLGHTVDTLLLLTFHQLFHTLPTDKSAVSVMYAHGELVVELMHQDGSIVRAKMSKSALVRGDDPVALVVFHDLTEKLWVKPWLR
jgi:PAS domain S-box-containing protein